MKPEEINKAIDAFAAALEDALGEELRAVLVYGSLVKGGYDEETSDHNVCLVLDHATAHVLRDVARIMREHRPSRRTTLLLLTREELARARDVFPLKLQDIGRDHRLVCGSDADLQAFSVEPAHLARDCEQQLRSLAIRGRRLFLRGTSNLDLLCHNLVVTLKGLVPPLAGLVELLGEAHPKLEDETLRRACALLGVDDTPLFELRRWKREPEYVPAESAVNGVLDGTMTLISAAAARADALHEASGATEAAPASPASPDAPKAAAPDAAEEAATEAPGA